MSLAECVDRIVRESKRAQMRHTHGQQRQTALQIDAYLCTATSNLARGRWGSSFLGNICSPANDGIVHGL